VHPKTEGTGKPMTPVLTPGQRHEATAFDRLMAQGAVTRPGLGRPRVRPTRTVGDKGYSSREIRGACRHRGIRHAIPHRRGECRTGPFDRAVYCLRARVERTINRCKQFRSLATRYDKHAASYRALWIIAVIILWTGCAH
jgi:transposase